MTNKGKISLIAGGLITLAAIITPISIWAANRNDIKATTIHNDGGEEKPAEADTGNKPEAGRITQANTGSQHKPAKGDKGQRELPKKPKTEEGLSQTQKEITQPRLQGLQNILKAASGKIEGFLNWSWQPKEPTNHEQLPAPTLIDVKEQTDPDLSEQEARESEERVQRLFNEYQKKKEKVKRTLRWMPVHKTSRKQEGFNLHEDDVERHFQSVNTITQDLDQTKQWFAQIKKCVIEKSWSRRMMDEAQFGRTQPKWDGNYRLLTEDCVSHVISRGGAY